MRRHCLIVAGGKGLRMGEETPKQFLLLNGKPILMHTISSFRKFDPDLNIVLALPSDQLNEWQNLCKQYDFKLKLNIVEGGKTRFHSVRNALDMVPEDGVVAVHDGVRPLLTQELIGRCYASAENEGNAIPCIPVSESMREINEAENHQVDRSKYVLIQTPQVFQGSLLKKAFCQPYENSFTDEASMIENMGVSVNLVKGDTNNLKITSKTDLLVAESILSMQQF